MTPEENAGCQALVALCADLETWATATADADGRIGVVDLIRVLDEARATLPEEITP